MIVTRKSVLTGKVRTRDLPNIKAEDLKMYEAGVISVSDAFPYLSSDDREFVICGITGRELKDAYAGQLKEIVNDSFGY